ncbi:MAG: arsenical-resistance protein, partial [Verrucomicrobia bacterium]
MSTNAKRMNFFERYLSLWVLVCMVLGVALGRLLPELTARLSAMEIVEGSQVNLPIAVLIWLMIYPMML